MARLQPGKGTATAQRAWQALDRRERRFLRSAWESRDDFSSGIVIPLAQGGGSAWVPAALALLAGGVVGLAWSLLQLSATSTVSPMVHGLLFVASCLALVGGGIRLMDGLQSSKLGDFILVGPLRLWEVSGGLVTECALDGLQGARVAHRTHGGHYTGSVVEVALADGSARIDVDDRDHAHEAAVFLTAVAKAPDADPTRIAAQAAAIAHGEEGPRGRRPVAHVPAPHESVPGGSGSRRSRRRATPATSAGPSETRRMVQILACAFVPAALCAMFVFPPFRARLREQHAYAQALESNAGVAAIDAYLLDHPDGPHAEEIRILRDDRLFEAARAASKRENSPEPLRAYLADPRNGRHRRPALQLLDGLKFKRAKAASEKENSPAPLHAFLADPEVKHYERDARRAISVIYDDALKKYEEAPVAGEREPEWVVGLAAAVREVRRAEKPTVLVRFRGSWEPKPAHPSQQLILALNRLMLLQPSDSFRDHSIRKREEALLARLAAAVTEEFGAALVTLRVVEGKEEPHIEFLYTVSADSTQLYVSSAGRGTEVEAGRAGDVREVMFKYAVNGTVTFHRTSRSHERRGRYFGGPDEVIQLPENAPGNDLYHAMLDSAFENLARQLVGKFGLRDVARPKDEGKPDATR